MAPPSISDIIKKYPISEGLDTFRDSFNSICAELGYRESPDTVQHFSNKDKLSRPAASLFLTYTSLKNLALDLFLALQNLSVTRYLSSSSGRGIIRGNLLRFGSLVISDDFAVKSIIPLIHTVVENEFDEKIWWKFYDLTIESTPPPR